MSKKAVAAPKPKRLTRKARELLAEEYLPFARGYLRRHFGANAEEHAGLAMFNAVDTFDASRGVDFKAWLVSNLTWTSRAEARLFDGRVGSRQHKAGEKRVTIQDYDRVIRGGSDAMRHGSKPESRMRENEQLISALREIERMPAPQRWIVLGRFLTDATDDAIARVIGRNAGHFRRTLVGIR